MKPFIASFQRLLAILLVACSLGFVGNAYAQDCGFSFSTKDSVWSFTAQVGSAQSRSLLITNTSNSTLVLSFGLSGDGFMINQKLDTLAGGDTMSVIITFDPKSTSTNTFTGLLTVTKLGTDCRKYLHLSGTSTAPANSSALVADPHEFGFGTVAFGSQVCKTFTITNTGTETAMNLSASLTCGVTDFNVSSWSAPSSIAPGQSATITICYKPHEANIQSTCAWDLKYSTSKGDGALVISLSGNSTSTTQNGDSVVIAADPHSYDFGTVAAGSSSCKDIVVTNKTSKDVYIAGWSLCDNKDFSVTPAATNMVDTLGAGSSMTFTICYTPHEANLQVTCGFTVKFMSTDPAGSGSMVVNLAANSTANTSGGGTCLKTEQGGDNKDAILVGTTADHTIYLINNSSRSITVHSAGITGPDAGLFTIETALPITVPANSSTTTLHYQFAPTSASATEYTATASLAITGDSLDCKVAEAHLIGYVVKGNSTTDSVVRPLFPSEKRVLAVEGSSKVSSSTFTFTNNLGVDATVNKVYMADGTYFTISSTNPSPTPFVLHPGDNLIVVVTYTATDNLVHHDQLMIDANHNLQAQSFDVQGLSIAASVANTLPVGVAINVSPNPTSSYLNVNMGGVASASIEVYDLLGNPVASANANSVWRWEAGNAVTGAYIVRIFGVSTDGQHFVTSKRVIVSK